MLEEFWFARKKYYEKNSGITTYLCLENVLDNFLHNAVSAPVDVITWKAPAIISINVIVDADFTIPV